VSGRGRPKKEGSKNSRLTVRVTEEDLEKLDYACYMTGMTRTDIFRKALKIYLKMLENQY